MCYSQQLALLLISESGKKQEGKSVQMSIAEKYLSRRSTYKFMEELDLIFEFPVLVDANS